MICSYTELTIFLEQSEMALAFFGAVAFRVIGAIVILAPHPISLS
ncbi:hypothetical protein ACFS07_11845 [Undibacterium arcticum]